MTLPSSRQRRIAKAGFGAAPRRAFAPPLESSLELFHVRSGSHPFQRSQSFLRTVLVVKLASSRLVGTDATGEAHGRV